MTQSVGQYRVGSTFNPSGNTAVDELKAKAAAFIDECQFHADALSDDMPPLEDQVSAAERRRRIEAGALLERAMREAEGAAMWAVKGVTKRVRE